MSKRPWKLQANASNKCNEIKDLLRLVENRRVHLKLSQRDLGDLSGMTQSAVSQMLSRRHNVSYVAIQHLASAIGISVKIKATNKALSKNCKDVIKHNEAETKRRNRRLEINSESKSGIRVMKVMEDE